jgi:hypothetical protein
MPLDSGEELLKALLGVRDRELLEDRSIGAGDPHLVAPFAYIHADTNVGSHRYTSSMDGEKLIQAITSTEQSHNP